MIFYPDNIRLFPSKHSLRFGRKGLYFILKILIDGRERIGVKVCAHFVMVGIAYDITYRGCDMTPSFKLTAEESLVPQCSLALVTVIEHLRIRSSYPHYQIGRISTYGNHVYVRRHYGMSQQTAASLEHSLCNAVEHHAVILITSAKYLIVRGKTDMIQSPAHVSLLLVII